uniref:KH domain-containing protein At4g18375 isoform X1 n=1 Tax=Elaeis guineensis var. tenera TaxID=51953 RepID=A0A6I9S519_ELAGV|nr:KH domain-containing protein At4g18375 isoform X1 [Elaeis guineensis]XP_010937188.2 KH domain-containing protein At4g18375 isoform X1 [Elaeis guineensis]XP_019709870.1 KH domain-containing protein At4g18375 isoform X1 [Elaeis guineensis]XP_019709871.1 KH domain-containing protein At4g18375 isoform X1 [Elaeis guineensis]XP_019709872.1 KH domain-containing protein At4g18375 isoform X1 [Elaeis guineensis]
MANSCCVAIQTDFWSRSEIQRQFDSMADWRNSKSKRPYYQEDNVYNWRSKRRNPGYDRDPNVPGPEDTVYRYLCPARKIGGIIGIGGEIVKQLRAETLAKIRIGENVPGCGERVITIISSSSETSAFGDTDDYICPAQDALFRVHEKLAACEVQYDEDKGMGEPQVTARLLVPSDQIGCVIGRGGGIIQRICADTGAQICILRDEHLPSSAVRGDGLLQITGEGPAVKKALFQVSFRLHDNPSQLQHLLSPNMSHSCEAGGPYRGPNVSDAVSERPRTCPSRDETSAREFVLRLLCPSVNIGQVIGKGGEILNQIRQDSRAFIKVDSYYDDDDFTISISAEEFFEDPISPTIDAAVRLQPRCSEKTEEDSGEPSYATRLLVSARQIGCLIGVGGSKISEMKRATRANIRIIKTDLPKAASDDDATVQISGDNNAVRHALIQVTERLRANLFGREDALSSILSSMYHFIPRDAHGHGCSYSAEYGTSGDVPPSEN